MALEIGDIELTIGDTVINLDDVTMRIHSPEAGSYILSKGYSGGTNMVYRDFINELKKIRVIVISLIRNWKLLRHNYSAQSLWIAQRSNGDKDEPKGEVADDED